MTPEDVADVIRAEWPDPDTEPELFDVVKQFMVHGPCGPEAPNAPCMVDGKCSKGFPKPFQDTSIVNSAGRIEYMRRNDGRAYEVRGMLRDNRSIVPYNPYLLLRYGHQYGVFIDRNELC